MKRFLQTVLMLLVCLSQLCLVPQSALADSLKTLRVAFYPLDGFFEYDDQGRETGYGVELLNRITRYTGIQFTYVQAESWESTKNMLLNGEADIRMPGTLPAVTSATLEYSQHSILDTYYAILAPNNRQDLIYNDLDAIKTLKIAISSSLYHATQIREYLKTLNLTEDNLVFYDGYNDCRAALDAGEVDALISNIMDLDHGMKVIARFASRANYISMMLGNPDLSILDDALFRIKMEDPTFFSNLYSKWFPEHVKIPLTKEESGYLSSFDHLSFYFSDGQGYLSRQTPDGAFEGIYPNIAQSICEKLQITCTAYDQQESSGTDTVIVPDFYYDYTWADEQGAAITEPYTIASYYKISKKGQATNDKTVRVAAVQNYRVTRDYIQQGYSEEQMYWCKDYAECIEAVYSGKADITYINRYTAEYYLNLYRYNNLSATLTDYSHQVCFAVYGENKELVASILSKSLLSISSDDLSAIVVQATSVRPEQNLLVEWFYQNPLRSVLVISLVAVALTLLIGMVGAAHRTKRQNLILRDATNAKQDFLSRISHDMRTPMNAIIGFSEFGTESVSLDEAHNYHQKIHDASEYLLQLINDTLDLSKIEAGTLQLHPEPYQSTEFIETVTNILRPKAEEKGVIFAVKNKMSNPETAIFDKLRLQQIFINLLNNAIKFTPAGGHVTLEIEVSRSENEECSAVFSVIDEGIGMTEDFQKNQLYKPFVQEHRIENRESGTGLGLSIVKELVTAMGGTISCQSVPGKGTTFTVSLKTKAVDPLSAVQQEKQPQIELLGKRILLCEDHPLNTEIAKKLLEKKGMLVEHAPNGQLAVAQFAKSAEGYYDAILMDIRMPVMNGFEATEAIRSLNRSDAAGIPIIAMTASAFEEDIRQCLSVGMNAHVAKPIEPQRLYEVLSTVIARKNNNPQ